MPDGKNYELVDGHLVERNMSQLSSWVAGQLYRFARHALSTKIDLGWAWPADLGYECFPDRPDKVRKPDVSFIRIERLPDGPDARGLHSHPAGPRGRGRLAQRPVRTRSQAKVD